MNISIEYLQKLILAWYADNRHWSDIVIPSKFSKDRGKLAKAASDAKSAGELILVVCNAIDMALPVLAKKCNIQMPRMMEIIRGLPLSLEESEILYLVISQEYMAYTSKI